MNAGDRRIITALLGKDSTMTTISESSLEEAVLEWFGELGWQTVNGPDLAPGATAAERESYRSGVLIGRLKASLARINPEVPDSTLEDVISRLDLLSDRDVVHSNRLFHQMLTEGVDVEITEGSRDMQTNYEKVWLLDLNNIDKNDWLVARQYTVVGHNRSRRADVVVFVNGIPVGIFELKNPVSIRSTVRNAFDQLQAYKNDVPSLFLYNEILVISDGVDARCGTIASDFDRFAPWRTIDGTTDMSNTGSDLEVLVKGIFDKERLLDYIRYFVVFEDDGLTVTKKMAAYHQYWATNRSIDRTLIACGLRSASTRGTSGLESDANPPSQPKPAPQQLQNVACMGNKRVGVVWHTQGSGKSLSMTFYAGKIAQHVLMRNPTIVVITDRNDLDDQLFANFAGMTDLLRQTPSQASSHRHLRNLLSVASGSIVFTTIQKFLPNTSNTDDSLLSERDNIVVIADEAHRSQYDFIDGYAKHMRSALPNAAFIGFTGTPIEKEDRNTRMVFGEYIDRYDIGQAVRDGATVPIYYENRVLRIDLSDAERPSIDATFDEITEGREEGEKRRLSTKWTALEALVGSQRRIEAVVEDLVEHFERRLFVMDGKALVVCMSRRIAVQMYDEICRLRPEWHSPDDDSGVVKVIMSGSASDEIAWQPHIRTKAQREHMARRFKDPNDHLKLVLVRDMWLTGFDCPCLHTMYVDKPMDGHNLMQAIARVNRVYRDKPGGLVVDYLGLAESLQSAVAEYTASGGSGSAVIDHDTAVNLLREKYEIVQGILHGFDYKSLITASQGNRISGLTSAMDHILAQTNGKSRYISAVSALSKAFVLAAPSAEALALSDDVAFFQGVRAALVKTTLGKTEQSTEQMESAIRDLVSKAIVSEGVMSILKVSDLDGTSVSVLSDQFLDSMSTLPQKNVAVELLKKLIGDHIQFQLSKNVVQARSFAQMLEDAVRRYSNRIIDSAEIIQELISIAKDIRQASTRGSALKMSDEEVAFYDALADNDSAMEVMGDKKLRKLATTLVQKVKQNVSIDWTLRQNARAKIRVLVKRTLREFGYPPDKQESATDLVLEQAEVLCGDLEVL